MKPYLFILPIALFTIVISCKKNNITVQAKAETPMQTIINSNFLDSPIIYENGPYELGYRFKSTKNGFITKIGCYVPQNLPYRVSLWDSATQELLVSTTLSVTDSTKFTYKDIAPVNIEAGKKYVISINNFVNGSIVKRFAFYRKAPYFNQPIFPINIGIITVVNGVFKNCRTTCFPNNEDGDNYLNGFPDFVFQSTEQ